MRGEAAGGVGVDGWTGRVRGKSWRGKRRRGQEEEIMGEGKVNKEHRLKKSPLGEDGGQG